MFGVFPFSVLHQSYAHEKINKSGRWGGWVSPLCSAPRYDDCVCVLRPTGSFFLFFCTSYFDAPFIRARIHSSFKPALKSFFFCCSSKSLCKQRGWNNSYGNRDAFGCNTAGCSPSAILPLCSREFPEHAAGERDTLPARSLVPLAFSCAFSLFVCRAALLFYFFFSENHLVATVFFLRFFPISKWHVISSVHSQNLFPFLSFFLLSALKKSLLIVHFKRANLEVVDFPASWNKSTLICQFTLIVPRYEGMTACVRALFGSARSHCSQSNHLRAIHQKSRYE